MCLAGLLLGCGDATEIVGAPAQPLGGGDWSGSCTTASYHAEQGRLLQGSRGSSFTIASVSLGCGSVQNLHVEGAQLAGTNRGAPISGPQFVGGIATLRDAAPYFALLAHSLHRRDAGS